MSILYITNTLAKLSIQTPYLLISHKKLLRQKVKIDSISQIVLWRNCYFTHEVKSLALFRRIPVLFVGNQGENLGTLDHLSKYRPKCLSFQKKRAFDSQFSFAAAESIIRAKLHNSRIVLQRLTLNNNTTPIVQTALDVLELLIDDLPMANSLQELREYGIMAGTFYYPALASLFPQQFGFKARKKQHPTDGINCLINLGNTLLHQTMEVFLLESGLHPYRGNLYVNCQYQTPLTCDLIAQFRAPLVDELVAELVLSQIIQPSDFIPAEQGGVSLHPGVLKTFFRYWEEKLQTEVIHPFAEPMSYRCCLQWQVKEYIAYLLENSDNYRPLVLRVDSAPINVQTVENKEAQLPLVARV